MHKTPRSAPHTHYNEPSNSTHRKPPANIKAAGQISQCWRVQLRIQIIVRLPFVFVDWLIWSHFTQNKSYTDWFYVSFFTELRSVRHECTQRIMVPPENGAQEKYQFQSSFGADVSAYGPRLYQQTTRYQPETINHSLIYEPATIINKFILVQFQKNSKFIPFLNIFKWHSFDWGAIKVSTIPVLWKKNWPFTVKMNTRET